MMRKLYKIETANLGVYWVVANHPTEAEAELKRVLDKSDYGFSAYREVKSIEIVAKEIDDTRFITGKNLIIVKPPTP